MKGNRQYSSGNSEREDIYLYLKRERYIYIIEHVIAQIVYIVTFYGFSNGMWEVAKTHGHLEKERKSQSSGRVLRFDGS